MEAPSRVTASARRPLREVLYANLRITDELMDHEADLVVLPGAGPVVVEVKGGEVWHDGQSWWQRRAGQPVRIHPVDQARDTKFALRRHVEGDPDHIRTVGGEDVLAGIRRTGND